MDPISEDQSHGPKDRPGIIAPPPLIFAAAFLAGWLCRNWFPVRVFLFPAVALATLPEVFILLGTWPDFTRSGDSIRRSTTGAADPTTKISV